MVDAPIDAPVDTLPVPIALRGVPVLVTGATGALGQHLVAALLREGAQITLACRNPQRAAHQWADAPVRYRAVDLTAPATLTGLCDGIDTVFHLASHQPAPHTPNLYNLPAHWTVSALGTRHLAEVIAASPVRRLVYASSVKVMGEAPATAPLPVDERTTPQPDTIYGCAKLAAEWSVLALGEHFPIQVSVLRLPMVYGLHGRGNVVRLLNAVQRGRFPPWPPVVHCRSAVHVADAVRALLTVVCDVRAAGAVYFVTDGYCYSTRWLYTQICAALGRPVPNWTVPLWTLRGAAALGSALEMLTGRAMPLNQDGLAKLTGNAWYSAERLRRELGFVAEHSLTQEIKQLATEAAVAD